MYFKAPPGLRVRAIPGAGLDVPIWILGSSLFGAQLAAELGLPYAFASHFAPGLMMDAIALYRQRFQPSGALDHPRVMLGINVVAADTDEQARLLFSSHQQAFVNLRRGSPGPLPPPDEGFLDSLSPPERREIEDTLSVSAVGSARHVHAALEEFVVRTGADELIAVSQIYDHTARLRSYELTSQMLHASAIQA
jgi:luciferase family oxidoreductase group 1